MASEITPLDTLLALSENFQQTLEQNDGAIERVFVRSVETPSEAFISRPSGIIRSLYALWGGIRKLIGLDRVRRYDQQANVQKVHALFKQVLDELPKQKTADVRKVIQFAIACDTLAGTIEGRQLFATFLFCQEQDQSRLKNARTIEEIFHCCRIDKTGSSTATAFNRICALAPAVSPQAVIGPVVDTLLSKNLQRADDLEAVWSEGKERMEKWSLVLPEDSEACDTILSRSTKLTDPLLRFVFVERLTPGQLSVACAVADEHYAAQIPSYDRIIPTWNLMVRLGQRPLCQFLPKAVRAIIDRLSDTQVPVSSKYEILRIIGEDLSQEQRETILKTWLEQFGEKGLAGLSEYLQMLGGSESILPMNEEMFQGLFTKYKEWLYVHYHAMQKKEIGPFVHEATEFVLSQERSLVDIARACPGSFRGRLLHRLQGLNQEEVTPIMAWVEKEVQAPVSTYDEAKQSYHRLTALKGELLRISPYLNPQQCLDRVDELLKQVDESLIKKNPQAHIAKTM
jgi:hypothetical protein